MSRTAESHIAAPATADGDLPAALASSDVFAMLADPVVLANPLPLATWLRENAPVYRTADGRCLVSRYEDVSRLLRASTEDIQVLAAGIQPGALELHASVRRLADTIGLRNPPEHTRLNQIYLRYFTPARVDALRERTRAIVTGIVGELAEELSTGQVVDLHRRLANALPTHMMSLLLDLSQEDVSWLNSCVWNIEQAFDPTITAERLSQADQSSAELDAFVIDLVARRRGGGGTDLITALADVEDDEGGLSQNDVIAMVFTLLAGGVTTMASVIALALWRTLVHRDDAERLAGSPAAVAAYVEELLRFESPAMYSPIPRVAVRDVEFGGEVLPAGTRVYGLIIGANHDPRAFRDPGTFDPSRFDPSSGRRDSAALAYGTGIHRCVGAHLASMEIEVVLGLLRERLPGLQVDGPVTWGRTSFIRSVTGLPVRLEKGSSSR
ncbi:cytochrome P450 [Lentzea sp. BCCO 10_0061]|uniref:Cytochrome P450 n=1 Tax=Lentzea sokolovensis TaxID=3095429 RepID=A0ABU4UPF0_9PSEU|nr:cytochrome P450 [Lentzea sp. BCCO 10_0061]MDX8141371.1 cytochrome P450 [Lentzea sp. BCCO 10_0061]